MPRLYSGGIRTIEIQLHRHLWPNQLGEHSLYQNTNTHSKKRGLWRRYLLSYLTVLIEKIRIAPKTADQSGCTNTCYWTHKHLKRTIAICSYRLCQQRQMERTETVEKNTTQIMFLSLAEACYLLKHHCSKPTLSRQ